MLDLIKLNELLYEKILELQKIRKEFKPIIENKANANAKYDKKIALTLIQLKNGKAFALDDNVVKDPPTTTSEKIAKGICWQEKLNMEKADARYKALLTTLDTLKVEINGLQSIKKQMDEIG